MSYLIIGLIPTSLLGAYIFYEKYVLPNAMRKVRDDQSKIKISQNREIANLQNYIVATGDRATIVLETVEVMEGTTLQQASLGEITEVSHQFDTAIKTLQTAQLTLSKRAQSGTPGAFKNFFTLGGNKQSVVAQAAEAAGFYGNNNINAFLTVVAQKFPDINNREKFVALNEERREAVIRKVKTNNLPGNQ